ncbi:MAG: hypothetical protein RJA63_150 [Pseudomonadota bacterium]|jgi:hypothetical protein
MAAVLTTSGRIAIATAIKARTAHLAWGSGDAAWGSTPPAPAANATALLAEVGRRKATLVDYCAPDANGAISVPEGKFSVSATPTNNLYFKFHFEFEEAVGSTIREQAIFLDTVAAAGVPAGQFYLAPAQVAQPGTLLVIERRAPIVREITTRQLFEFVVTF